MCKFRCLIVAVLVATAVPSHAQSFSVIKLPKLLEIMAPQNDTAYVINFWATWCGPCVSEFKNFQNLAEKHKNEKVKVIFISLDFERNHKKTLIPFIRERRVKEPVYLLDEPDYNSWIDKVDKDWGGELPATLFINQAAGKKLFWAKPFTYKELEETFKQFISK